jgi:hypothetical protein
MSSEGSIDMLSLLKELSVYKSMDEDYAAGAKGHVETEAFEDRGRRRREIAQEMQRLAADSKRDRSDAAARSVRLSVHRSEPE